MARRVHPDERQDVMALTQALVAAADGVRSAFVAAQGLHATDVGALMLVLDAHEAGAPMTPGRLGRGLGLSSGAVTALVDRLEAADVLRRVRDEEDRRRVLLQVSDQGHAVADRYLSPIQRRTDEVLAQFDDGERAVVRRFLRLTTAAMVDQRTTMLDADGGGVGGDG